MKKIILIFFVFTIMLSSCKKEDNKPKQTRLKTYTHEYYERIPASLDKYTIEYNSANKISKVIYESNCVLSPISAIATSVTEVKNASISLLPWRADNPF